MLSDALGDKVYRYGGEEFCALFKGMSEEDALLILNKVRRRLEEREFVIRKPHSSKDRRKEQKKEKTKKVQITISIGVASPCRDICKPADVIKLADQALYQAKKKGRNCVVAWETEEEKPASKKKKKSAASA